MSSGDIDFIDTCDHFFIERNGYYVCKRCGVVSDEPVFCKTYEIDPEESIYYERLLNTNTFTFNHLIKPMRTSFDPAESNDPKRFMKYIRLNRRYDVGAGSVYVPFPVYEFIRIMIAHTIDFENFWSWIERALYLCYKIYKSHSVNRMKHHLVASYVVYHIINEQSYLPLKRFLKQFNIPVREYRYVSRMIWKNNFNIGKKEIIPSIYSLGIKDLDASVLNEIDEKIRVIYTKYKYVIHMKPMTIMTTLYYYYCKKYNVKRTQRDIYHMFGIHPNIITAKLKILRSYGIIGAHRKEYVRHNSG